MKRFRMKLGIFGISFLIVAQLVANTSGNFEAANESYNSGEYEKAAELYETLIPQKQSSAVFYNLGNTYYQLQDYPKAILQFEKALALAPTNPEIRANLKLTQEAAQLQPTEPSWTEVVAVKMNVNVWAWIAVVTFWGGAALIILPPLWGWRGPIKSGLIVLCVLLFAVSTIGLVGYHQLAKLGIAISDEAALKISPTSTSPTKEYLKPGESASIQRKHGNFFFVRTAEDKEGWVDSDFFKPVWD
ncbi:tetratricopeptide repeat protein [Rubellicoccus peritrichatus]|uniref:Tetratricopeptide repeat protein n=1 Tax=Rubellicoccus peritrichatus TaxID=3080537 RepID=A0AAQ3LAJ4_9BACT|nr:tetratricopeptide repeat protein [Puniceicoccus sp. CR14]WOO42290.1 tetratricopeptide repeat protein [Puniceicoccus sp. CR14]